MKEKKTIGIILGVVVVILLMIGASVGKDSSSTEKKVTTDSSSILENAQKESDSVKEEEKKEFDQIDINEYIDKKASPEKSLILVARPTCHYCQIAEPILQKIAKEKDLDIDYLNTDNFSQEDQTTFVQSDESFNNGYGTPILLVVQNDEITDKVDGLTDYDHYIEFFKKNGFID